MTNSELLLLIITCVLFVVAAAAIATDRPAPHATAALTAAGLAAIALAFVIT